MSQESHCLSLHCALQSGPRGGRAGASTESAEARLLPIVRGQNVGAPGGAWGWRLWAGVQLNPRERGDPGIVWGLRRGGGPVVVVAGDGQGPLAPSSSSRAPASRVRDAPAAGPGCAASVRLPGGARPQAV